MKKNKTKQKINDNGNEEKKIFNFLSSNMANRELRLESIGEKL